MSEHYTYLLVDALCILFPLLFSFYPRLQFYRQWRFFALPCALTATVFIVWDVLFTRMGVWSFNPAYVIGAYLLGLPVEEYLFFLCIPYACVFTYYSLGALFRLPSGTRVARVVTFVLIGFLLTTALYHLPQLYTSVTFIALAIVLVYLGVVRQARYMGAFYRSFIIILVPFFISNGVLTGYGLAAPVVSYNPAYNMGIRMATIPFEDTFYGMLLLLLNVAGYEYSRRRAGLPSLAQSPRTVQ